MRKGKHTPGPWTVEDPMGPEILSIVARGERAVYEWLHVAQMAAEPDEADDIPRIEAEANALLIAAAPDLLEFSEKLLIYKHEDDDRIWLSFDGHSVGFEPESDAARVLLHIEASRRAAIAKAEGRTE